MVIHGLNWAVLACLENSNGKTVREAPWHNQRFIYQLLYSPFVMIYELIRFLLWGANIGQCTMDENVCELNQDKMQQFQYLQEFYLYFGQFFAHTAYALLISWICSAFCLVKKPTFLRVLVSFLLYIGTSLFFLFGRIQLGTLFKAENKLKEKSSVDDTECR